MLTQKLMAFWPYHGGQSRHFCCGEVASMDYMGYVETVEFGKGYFVKPVAILPYASGVDLKTKLEILEDKHRCEQDALNAKQLLEVDEITKGILPPVKKGK